MKRRRRTLHPGQVLAAGGRQFMCIRVSHVRSRRGLLVPILVWTSTCAESGCGRAFEQTTCRKPRPIDMQPRCRQHFGTKAERRAQRRRAAILDSLVAELPDGSLVTLAGDPVERDPEPTPDDAGARRDLDPDRLPCECRKSNLGTALEG